MPARAHLCSRVRQPYMGTSRNLPLFTFIGDSCPTGNVLLVQNMAAAKAGEPDKQALFAQCALPHKDYVYTACLYLTRHKEEAEDLFQDTYLRAFRFFHQFTPGTNCRAWLLTIMHNAFKNRYPQRLRESRTVEFDDAAPEYEKKLLAHGEASRDDPAEVILSQMVDSEITDALRALPERKAERDVPCGPVWAHGSALLCCALVSPWD